MGKRVIAHNTTNRNLYQQLLFIVLNPFPPCLHATVGHNRIAAQFHRVPEQICFIQDRERVINCSFGYNAFHVSQIANSFPLVTTDNGSSHKLLSAF